MKVDRRRVRNSVKCEFNGIEFNSKLEVMVYKTLLEQGIDAQYECESFKVSNDHDRPIIPFFTKNKYKRKNRHIEVLSANTVIDRRKVEGVTYTPDFQFEYKGKTIIIEAKGLPTEAYKYRFKLFRSHLEQLGDTRYEIWEIYTRTQLLDCIKHLRNEDIERH